MNKLYSSIDLVRLNKNQHITFLNKKENTKSISYKRKAIFFDRDGVIIEDCHYIKNHENVKLCPGVKDFIRYLHNQKHKIIIITNQSGISRNFFSWEDYEKVTNRMLEMFNKKKKN